MVRLRHQFSLDRSPLSQVRGYILLIVHAIQILSCSEVFFGLIASLSGWGEGPGQSRDGRPLCALAVGSLTSVHHITAGHAAWSNNDKGVHGKATHRTQQ